MPDDLTRAQEEAVRRLLAGARETAPMPDDVAARLDAVLADLAGTTASAPADAAGEAEETPATVVPLRRRRWPRLVLAAAAVTAVGLGTVQVLDRTGGGLGDDSAPADSAGRADGGTSELEVAEGHTLDAPAEPRDGDAAVADDGPPVAGKKELGDRHDRRATVTLTGLDRALQAEGLPPVGRLRTVGLTGRGRPHANGYASSGDRLDHVIARSAAVAGWTCGPLYAVPDGATYTSTTRPDTLVVAHPPANGIRIVEVYDCAGDEPRRSSTVVTLTTPE